MRSFVFATIFALEVKAASSQVERTDDPQFEDFKARFGRHYASEQEEEYRHKVFRENLRFIDAENKKGKSYMVGVTNFADLTFSEWRSQYLTGYKPSMRKTSFGVFRAPASFAAPDSVDWTTKGAVTPVKNQAQCGSCWSFSTTGSIEGRSAIKTGTLASISEQQLVDCDTSKDHGCNGGLMDYGFQYVISSGGLCSEVAYPYEAAQGTCKSSSCGTKFDAISSYEDVASCDQDSLEAALCAGPVSIAIEADQSSFQQYTGGVLTGDCGKNLDHGVLLVGFGTDSTYGDYWKVKNSWGSTWGDAGFVKLLRGKGGTGECGLLSQPSYPVVKASADVSMPMTSHYEDPAKGGCQKGELNIQVQGVKGDFCTPECTNSACPTDVPAGVTAQPQCVLQNAADHKKYCALICHPGPVKPQCGTAASCKSIQGTGICTYDDSGKFSQEVMFAPANEVVV